jgi:2-hydroxy-3-oxopropionate reductase
VKSVGVIGLGSMGGPMATHLVGAGFDVHVFDVRRSAIHQAVSAGARATASIREVAERSEAVIVMVVDDEQTRDVVAGPEGLLDGSRKGLIVVLSSSLHPGTARSLYALARDRGVEVVDVPVTGGVRGAIEGKLTCLVGGDENTYQRIKPVLDAVGNNVVHVGSVGSGQVAKVVHNVLLWLELAATSEALQLAASEGLSVSDVQRAMVSCPANNHLLQHWDEMYTTWAAKDLSAALEMAEGSGLPMPVSGLVRELLKGWQRPDLLA